MVTCVFDMLCSTAWMADAIVSSNLVDTGGEEEAMTAYEEAMQAMFGLQLERYSHVQPHRNPESGKLRWECFELWPLQVGLALSASEGTILRNISVGITRCFHGCNWATSIASINRKLAVPARVPTA